MTKCFFFLVSLLEFWSIVYYDPKHHQLALASDDPAEHTNSVSGHNVLLGRCIFVL